MFKLYNNGLSAKEAGLDIMLAGVRAFPGDDPAVPFTSQTLTFEFTSPNMMKHKFNCYAQDFYKCGELSLTSCSKSKYGYTIMSHQKYSLTYNEKLYETCHQKPLHVNDDIHIKEQPAKEYTPPSERASATSHN